MKVALSVENTSEKEVATLSSLLRQVKGCIYS
jgi:hypothetical protein